MRKNKLIAIAPALAIVGTLFTTTPATAAPGLSDEFLQSLYERYTAEQVDAAITADNDLITASSAAWDAQVDAEAAEQVAINAEQAHQVAVEEEQAALEYAKQKDAEASELAYEALQAYQVQQRTAGGGMLPPELTALVMGPADTSDYITSMQVLSNINDNAERAAAAADEASKEADAAHAEAERLKRIADNALETANETRKEADRLSDEAQQLLDEAIAQSDQAAATMVLDETANPATAPGPELVRSTVAQQWWSENAETETSKERGATAVETTANVIATTVAETNPDDNVETEELASKLIEPPVDENAQATNAVNADDKEDKKAEKLALQGKDRADEAVALLGTPVRSGQCLEFVASQYGKSSGSFSDLADLAGRFPISEAIPGDVIYFKARDGKVDQAGVYMGAGMAVIGSDAAKVYTAVPASNGLFASRPGTKPNLDDKSLVDSERWKCGTIPARDAAQGIMWTIPFKEYTLSEDYSAKNPWVELTRTGSDDGLYAPISGIVSTEDEGTITISSGNFAVKLEGISAEDLIVRAGYTVRAGEALGLADYVKITARSNERAFNPQPLMFDTWVADNNAVASGTNRGGQPAFDGVPESENAAVSPVANPHLSSLWGPRVPPVPGAEPFHRGIDFAAAAGTPVVSILDGVVWATFSDAGSGNQVIVQYNVGGRDYAVVYKHLSSSPDEYVSVGDVVEAGQQIGRVGSTGIFSTGPHLHLEVWDTVFNRDHHIDALAWLRALGVNI